MSDVGQEVQSLLGFSQSNDDVTSSAMTSSRLEPITERMDVDDEGLLEFHDQYFPHPLYMDPSQQVRTKTTFF